MSNAGDDCDGDESETDDVCYSVRKAACLMFDGFDHWCRSMVSGLLPLAFYQLGMQQLCHPAVVLFASFTGVHSLISCQLHTCCAESQ